LAKYADVYVAGESKKQIAEGIYEVPLNHFDLKWEDYDGILAYHSELFLDLLHLFRVANVPILIQIYAPRGHAGKAINSILFHYSAMRDFDGFAAPSASVGRFYSQFVPDTSCFYVLPMGVDGDEFKPMDKQTAKAEIAQMLDDSRITEKPVVGYLSRFQPEKGASIYIEVARRIPDAIFLVGAHTLRHYRLRDLPKNLIYAGFQPREKLPLLYNAFDVYCFPTMAAEETFGLTVLEAMACGVPPVVPNFDGVPDVVGDAGIVVEAENFSHDIGSFASYVSAEALSDGIQELLNQPEKRLLLGKQAQ
jgi:glycosyltransferase involved in cell wall biosynthesis